MVRLDQVWKSFSGSPALKGVSLSVAQGDAVLLTGPSGAGKTTLLKLVFAAERADRGEVFVAGRSLAKLRESSIPYVRRNIGVVFQDFKLLGDRSALDNVAVALEILGLPRKVVVERSLAMIERVGLSQRAHTRASALAGGEQQRVAIARALVNKPAILLCDEPTGNLDPERSRQLLELLESIHAEGTTLFIATHDPEVVDFGLRASWRSVRLVDGELLDADIPIAKRARLDEDTQAIPTGRDRDATRMGRLLGVAGAR